MIIFVVALKAEISWLIDLRDLKLIQKEPFSIYSDDRVAVIISRVGYINSAVATSFIINRYKDIQKIINLGIAGAKDTIKIGSLYSINKLIDNIDSSVHFLKTKIFQEATLTTFARPKYDTNNLKTMLVDMEASAFYKSSCFFLNKEKIHIIKIVSDNLDDKQLDISFIEDLFKKNSQKIIKGVL